MNTNILNFVNGVLKGQGWCTDVYVMETATFNTNLERFQAMWMLAECGMLYSESEMEEWGKEEAKMTVKSVLLYYSYLFE